jgi:hypothetical protein
VLIANYNATPHSGLGWRAPLDQFDFLSRREDAVVRTADSGAVRRMVGVRKRCTVLGGVRAGRRPYFNVANARYSAEWLCLRQPGGSFAMAMGYGLLGLQPSQHAFPERHGIVLGGFSKLEQRMKRFHAWAAFEPPPQCRRLADAPPRPRGSTAA